MSAARRLAKELAELRSEKDADDYARGFTKLQVDETNILQWNLHLLPEKIPYNKGAFKIRIDFPCEYPFKPPKVTFNTKIYHPNIDDKGQVCLPIITSEHWKPATRADQVIQALLALVNDPEVEHPLRADLADEYQKDRQKFINKAEAFTKQHAEARP